MYEIIHLDADRSSSQVVGSLKKALLAIAALHGRNVSEVGYDDRSSSAGSHLEYHAWLAGGHGVPVAIITESEKIPDGREELIGLIAREAATQEFIRLDRAHAAWRACGYHGAPPCDEPGLIAAAHDAKTIACSTMSMDELRRIAAAPRTEHPFYTEAVAALSALHR